MAEIHNLKVPVVEFPGSPWRLHQPFLPAGDQPEAIDKLVEGVNDGEVFQILLGVVFGIWGLALALPLVVVIKVMPKVGRHRNRLVDLYRYHSFSSAPRGDAVLFRMPKLRLRLVFLKIRVP